MEHCIIYFSSSVELLDEDEITGILQQSRRHNIEAGITGVLLYVRGNIIQVLEGEKAQLNSVYQRIEQDPRHKNIVQILDRPITHRLFPAYSMGYETLTTSQLDEIQELVDLDKHGWSTTETATHPILKTIKLFYESNHYN